jgi:HEAT repeat protein
VIQISNWFITLVLLWLAGLTMFLVGLTAAARIVRGLRERRRTRRIERAQPLLYELMDDEEGRIAPAGDDALDILVLALLPRLRGADRTQLCRFLDQRGVLARARRRLDARTAVTRAESAELLGGAGDHEASSEITVLLRDRDLRVRIAAARALGRLGHPSSTPALLAAYLDTDRPIGRGTLGMAILRIGASAAPTLRTGLESELPAARAFCAELLGHLGDLDSLPALLTLLEDEREDTVRANICRALGRIGSPLSTKAIALYLSGEHPVVLRQSAAWALGTISDPKARRSLLNALHDPDTEVASTAAQALLDISPNSLSEASCCDMAKVHADDALSSLRVRRPAFSGAAT